MRLAPSAGFVAGKYRVFATLGHGGMADVFLAAAQGPAGFNKLVVVKKLRETRTSDPSYVSMFLDEARLAARLNHPNVVHTYEVGEHGDGYFIAMEYLEGQPLSRISQAAQKLGQALDPIMAAHLVAEALRGLHHAHEMRDYDDSRLGIVHRDVSPQNLHVTFDGRMVVLDFGIAKAALNTSQTQAGVLKGKFAYMSPEQAAGDEVDARSDIFAAGIVLWELLACERLFKGDNAAVLGKLLTSSAPAPSTRNPAVPPVLDALVLRALERSPTGRYASAEEMANALEDYVLATGRRVRRDDVARLMTHLFGDIRGQLREQIQLHMAALPPAPTPPPSDFSAFASTGANSSVVSASGIVERSGVRAPPDAMPPDEDFDFGAGRRRARSALLGLAVLAGIGGAGFAGARLTKLDAQPAATAEPVKALHAAMASAPLPSEAESFHLTLSSEPLEARVEWAGRHVGHTPMMIDLLPGAQTFVLSRDGYYSATIVVNVTDAMAEKTQSRTVVLVPRGKPGAGGGGARTQLVVEAPMRAATGAKTAPPAPSDGERIPARASAEAQPAQLASSAPQATAELAPQALPAVAAPVAPLPPSNALAGAGAGATSAVLPFGPEMSRPVLLSGSDPVYPREAVIAGVEGVMIAKCTITTAGTLESCRIVKGLPHMDKSMLDSLATRRYRPVMHQGRPVAVEYVFNVKLVRPR